MHRLIFLLALLVFTFAAATQPVEKRLAKAWSVFAADPQLRSAMASLYVEEEGSGKPVFDRNSRIGLAPASTQKIITAAAAYDLLGADFRYRTGFAYAGTRTNGQLAGSIIIKPSGDPTLGSWRWPSTTESAVAGRVAAAVAQAGIRRFSSFLVDARGWEGEAVPGGWIWDDIGNYYGAGAAVLNWRENQYDVFLRSGASVGDPVTVVGTKPVMYNLDLVSNATAAAKGSGDNAYLYFPLQGSGIVVRGTIPAGEERFTISGAMPSGQTQFLLTLTDSLAKRGINRELMNTVVDGFSKAKLPEAATNFHTEVSPPLDSISYWFLKRSINLYGEALVKTMAAAKAQAATTENGAALLEAFWAGKGLGIDATELHLYDGSGLSPLNRTTTHAQVAVLQYASRQPWFAGYANGFPAFNNMKLKSGTISRVKSFCGYHRSREGRSYVVSFIVNNYNGSAAALVQKMYKLLDELK